MDNRVLVFAGAGISAESGLNTFRDTGGIWTQYDVNEVCNMRSFMASKHDEEARQHLFGFYNLLKQEVQKAKPNHAHELVAQWQSQYGSQRVVVVTANVDDLFEKAGVANVVHVHGEMNTMECVACTHQWSERQEFDSTQRCPRCNSRLTKPGVVFFGQMAPRYREMASIFNIKKRQAQDVVLCIGTSLCVIGPEAIVQNRHHPNARYNVLVNKERGSMDFWFNHRYYGLATEQLQQVQQDLIVPLMSGVAPL